MSKHLWHIQPSSNWDRIIWWLDGNDSLLEQVVSVLAKIIMWWSKLLLMKKVEKGWRGGVV